MAERFDHVNLPRQPQDIGSHRQLPKPQSTCLHDVVKTESGLNFTPYVPSVNSYFTQGVPNVNSHLIPGMSRNYANSYSAQGMPAQTHDFRHGDSAFNSRQYIPNTYQSEGLPSSVTHRKVKEPNTFDGKSSEWRDYVVHFECVASWNGWTEFEKA